MTLTSIGQTLQNRSSTSFNTADAAFETEALSWDFWFSVGTQVAFPCYSQVFPCYSTLKMCCQLADYLK